MLVSQVSSCLTYMISSILGAILAISVASTEVQKSSAPVEKPLALHTFSLEKRYSNEFVNDVFKDNILYTIDRMAGNTGQPNWQQIEKPKHYEFVLNPQQTFSFHDTVLPQYQGKIVKTTNSHFDAQEGFKSDNWLFGDGVCHMASLLYWVAKDAKLDALAPVRHDFAPVPEVPREYGVSIYSAPGQDSTSAEQNLYITNTYEKPIVFAFDYNGKNLTVSASFIN